MAEHPQDTISRANRALKGIIDILTMVNQNDLHLVHPDHLGSLLDLVADEFQRAEEAMERHAA